MNAVPVGVLVRALQALNAANEHLLNPSKFQDPYMAVMKARSELGYYVNKLLEAGVSVDKSPEQEIEGVAV